MVDRSFAAALVLALTLTLAPEAHARCGVELWDRKTGIDPEASSVSISSAKDTTIGFLRGLPVPAGFPTARRAAPAETTFWHVKALLKEAKVEADEDYHLVLVDDSGQTMIAEIPTPHCVGANSPFLAGITQSRTTFESEVPISQMVGNNSLRAGQMVQINVQVNIRGVGFYDRLHGQTGVAPNGIELHPVLSIEFLQHPHITPPAPLTGAMAVSALKEEEDEEKEERAAQSDVAHPAAPGATGTQLIGDPSLEAGPGSPWKASESVLNKAEGRGHTGAGHALLGGRGRGHRDELRQLVKIPAAMKHAQLTYWMRVDKHEGAADCEAKLVVQVHNANDEVVAVVDSVPASGGSHQYEQRTVDLSDYKGKPVHLVFIAEEDPRCTTSFALDDVELRVSR